MRKTGSHPLRTAAALGLVTLLTFTLLTDKATTQEAKPKSTKPSESEASSQLENKSAQTDVISGVVVDENGDPIVGAIIVSYPIVGSQEVRLITGHDGKFVIDLLQYPTARSNFKAAVFKAGHILSSVDSMKQPIRVILAESKSFEVDVRSPDGQPVQNALVTPGTVRFETFIAPPPESLERDIATGTDANGRATLTSVQPAELLSLVINSGEWGKQQFALPRYPTTNQKTFLARLRKVGRVVGRITDKTGMPMQGFKFGCASSVLGANNSQGDSASTDVDGRFRMILPTGRYRFFASVGQEIAFEPVTVQISREKEVSLELQVQPPCEVSGRAITDSGLPLENLHVTAWRLGDSRTVLTDAKGHFVFKLPPGDWSYDCYPGETVGFLPNEHNQAAFKVPEGGSMSLPTIIAKTGQIIEGQILGIDLSVPRIRAVVAHAGKMRFGCHYDDTGRFQLTLPKSLLIENIEKFEIRFIDSPVEVVSTDPLVLALSTGPAPPISAKETLKKKMQGMLTANEKERALLVQAFRDFLEGVDVEANDLRGAMQIVSFLDSKGDRQLAEGLCKLILAKHADREEFAAEISLIQGTLDRLSLVGKPFDLTGREALSRNEFDWSAFRGKVVLVQFWATWCGPCKEDLKIALDLHERFSNQNFAVVGVSTDSDSAKLQGFLNDSDFPWPTIHSPVDAPENLSKKLGVSEIPFNFVIGADGKVLAVNRRHDELVRFVEAQFR